MQTRSGAPDDEAPADDEATSDNEPPAKTASDAAGDEATGDTTGRHDFPFGRPGRPFRSSPFLFGFTGALGVALAYLLVQAIVGVRQVLILLVIAMFLAIGLNPAVEWLQRRRIPRTWAVVIVFVAVLLFVAGFVSAIVPPLVGQSQEFWQHRDEYLTALQNNQTVSRLDNRFHLVARFQEYLDTKGSQLGGLAATGIIGLGKAVLGTLFSAFCVLVLTLYFLASLPKIKHSCYQLAPRSRRERVTLLGDEIIGRVGGYVSGATVIAFIAGVTTYIWLLAWQVPYALPLALTVMLLDLIPMVGATIGAVLVTLVSFANGVGTGVATGLFYIAYQQAENYLIYPRVMRRAVELPPAITVIAILIGGSLLGVLGALLAIPLAAAALLLFREVALRRLEHA